MGDGLENRVEHGDSKCIFFGEVMKSVEYFKGESWEDDSAIVLLNFFIVSDYFGDRKS